MTFEEMLQRKMDDGLRQGIQKGIQEGLQKGIAKGITEGIALTKRVLRLNAQGMRFPPSAASPRRRLLIS